MASDSSAGPDLSVHPLAQGVQHAVPTGTDESRVGLTTLIGYIGPSPEETVHIYIDLSFDTYCVVDRSDVVNTAPVDTHDPNSPTIIWIQRAANIRLITTQQYSADADVMAGAIYSLYQDAGVGDGDVLQTTVKKSTVCTYMPCVIGPPPPPPKTAWTCPKPK